MAIAVLYVVVIIMAGTFLRQRGILIAAAVCVALTMLSYALQHGNTNPADSLGRCLMSLSAIGVTTALVIRNRSSGTLLRERASLLDLSHDTIIVRNMADVITYWNTAAEQMYGWSKDEATGQISHQLMQTEFPMPLAEIMAELLRTGRWEGELVHTTRDDRKRVVASRWSLQRNDDGRPVAILETNNDVTDRKRAETKIHQQEKDLRLALDTLPTLAAWARPDGYLEYLNRRWLDYTGLSLEQASGWGWEVAVHPEDLAGVLDQRRAILAAGKPAEMEARMRRADGEYRWFLTRTHPLRDSSGTIIRWYTVHIDIQDRKAAEDALRRSETYLAEAQLLSRTGSFGWRSGNRELAWSQQTYRIFGYDPTLKPTIELVLQRVHPDDVAFVRRSIERGSRIGAPLDLAHRVVMPDGFVKHVKVLAHATKDRSYGWEYIGAITDITAAKQAEQALQRAQAELAHATRVATLGELAASIVHEVNQPLAAIVANGNAGMRFLDRDPPDLDEIRGSVDAMVRDGLRAAEVIRRVRAHARKTDPQKVHINVGDVINEVLVMIERELLAHRVTVRTELADGLPSVLGDRVQLQQVVINLIMNGVDAMASIGNRPRELVIRTEQLEGNVLVAVQDCGIGFDSKDADRLFDAFFSTKADGMGMGLPICRSIIEAHGGRLWATRNDDAGATFRFSLPQQSRIVCE
jgi:PAS domain S-box-containing protein